MVVNTTRSPLLYWASPVPVACRSTQNIESKSHHGSTWLYKPLAKVMQEPRIWPLRLGYRWADFDQTWNNIRTTRRPPTTQNRISMRRCGWSGRIPSLPLFGFFVLFWFLSHAHRSHQWTDFDDLYVIRRVFTHVCAFCGLRWYCSPFTWSHRPKRPNLGEWIGISQQNALYSHSHVTTSISANADGPRDAASRKLDHIARPTKYNYQATSVGR